MGTLININCEIEGLEFFALMMNCTAVEGNNTESIGPRHILTLELDNFHWIVLINYVHPTITMNITTPAAVDMTLCDK